MKTLGKVHSSKSFFWNDPHQTLVLIYIPLCMLVVQLLPNPHSKLIRGSYLWALMFETPEQYCLMYCLQSSPSLSVSAVHYLQDPFSWAKRQSKGLGQLLGSN